MNGHEVKEVVKNNFFTIVMALAAVVLSAINAYTFQQLSPLRQDLAIFGQQVRALESTVSSYSEIPTTLSAIKQQLMSMDKQLDRIEERGNR